MRWHTGRVGGPVLGIAVPESPGVTPGVTPGVPDSRGPGVIPGVCPGVIPGVCPGVTGSITRGACTEFLALSPRVWRMRFMPALKSPRKPLASGRALVVAFVALKGGSGKTTVAVQFSCALATPEPERYGASAAQPTDDTALAYDVLLVDVDKKGSGSASSFGKHRRRSTDKDNPLILDLKGPTWTKQVEALRDRFDVVVLDGPPENEQLARRMMMLADIVVLPVVPTPQCVETLMKTDDPDGDGAEVDENTLRTFRDANEVRQELGLPPLRLVGVVTSLDKRSATQVAWANNAKRMVEEAGGTWAPQALSYLNNYNDLWPHGLGVAEASATKNDRRARDEAFTLARQILSVMEDKTDEQGTKNRGAIRPSAGYTEGASPLVCDG